MWDTDGSIVCAHNYFTFVNVLPCDGMQENAILERMFHLLALTWIGFSFAYEVYGKRVQRNQRICI